MRHPNIVPFYGLYFAEDIPHIVTEYMPEGALDKFLASNKGQVPFSQLLGFAQDTVLGMMYLGSCNVIHRLLPSSLRVSNT